MPKPAVLLLEDGTLFNGFAFGYAGEATGESCFNTSLSGYQEIITDPSYAGQIVAMTAPMIGNYGANNADTESAAPALRG
ncbi:carbamoyl phosphate synthase small subunit, partial [Candidatus Termititenax persephonae]